MTLGAGSKAQTKWSNNTMSLKHISGVSSKFFLIRIKIGFVSQICLISGIFVDWARDP